jgi:hypothetical protein
MAKEYARSGQISESGGRNMTEKHEPEKIKDLPKKEKDRPITEEELGDVAGGFAPPIVVGGQVGVLKPGETSNPNFEASTDGKPPTSNG